MSVAFRNVDAHPDDPVDTWPYEAIVTVIERGTIGDWLRLTRAIDDERRAHFEAESGHFESQHAIILTYRPPERRRPRGCTIAQAAPDRPLASTWRDGHVGRPPSQASVGSASFCGSSWWSTSTYSISRPTTS